MVECYVYIYFKVNKKEELAVSISFASFLLFLPYD